MEEFPAASAMDWSIDLDRGLRSRHPSTRLQALHDASPRLRELATATALPPAVASALGVLSTEPRLYAETMLLRLATEFRDAQDHLLRARVVRSLLVAGRPLVEASEPDQILRRVAAAYAAAGSARARALALRMLGCLAGLAKDSVHARSLLLSGLCSSDAAEVKAALFATGCFCELSEDFSCITLQVLTRLITSPTSQAEVILTAIKAFSKLDCTLAAAHRVHEVGKQIVLGNLEDTFKVEMLLSLSRLSARSIILFSDQVEFLLLFLGRESSLSMKTMALKCLFFMFRRNTFHLPVVSTVFRTLLQLIDDEELTLDCKSYAFSILQKMSSGKAPIIHHVNASELSKLAFAAESSLNCGSWEMQGTALEILVDVFCFLKQIKPCQTTSTLESSSFSYTGCQGIAKNMLSAHEQNNEDRSLNKVITALVDHIIFLVNDVISNGSKETSSRHISVCSELKKCKAVFRLMLKLVAGYPSAAPVALGKLRCLIKQLAQINGGDHSRVAVNCVESFVTPEEFSASNVTVEPVTNSKNKAAIVRELIICTLKFANVCHDMLRRTSSGSCNFPQSVKGLIECLQQNASQYCSTYESFHLIMCVCISWNTSKIRDGNQESGDPKERRGILFTPSVWIAQELCALRMTKMLTRKQSYWEAYRSAIYCCREGIWFTASFVFRKLADAFESGSSSFWFKSLLFFSAGETELKLFLFPSATIKLVGELKTEDDLHENLYCVATDVDSTLGECSGLDCYQAKISGICSRTCLANETLSSNASLDCEFLFQRWFISLRASFLEILADVLGIVSAYSSEKDMSHHEARGDHLSVSIEHSNNQVLALSSCSLRLSELAKSYDLLAISHGDMDHQSFSNIARLAFMCSLLSFCTAFSVDFAKSLSGTEPCRLPDGFSYASVLQDLHERADRSDSQIVSQLRQFMFLSSDEVDSLQLSTRMNCSGNLEKDSYLLFKFAVASLLHLRVDAKGETTGEESLSPLHRGMQVLSSILQRFMELPFVVPKYFFSVRPCLGAELLIFDSNPANKDRISVPPGSQLSLTLCLRWRRVLERTSIRIAKLYCILVASSSSSSSSSLLDNTAGTRSKQFEMRSRTVGDMVELNRRLLRYIKRGGGPTRGKKMASSSSELATAFACFEAGSSSSSSSEGQGFSDCLLDVSSFHPRGSSSPLYRIAWQACCVDENGCYFSLLPLNDGAAFSIIDKTNSNR